MYDIGGILLAIILAPIVFLLPIFSFMILAELIGIRNADFKNSATTVWPLSFYGIILLLFDLSYRDIPLIGNYEHVGTLLALSAISCLIREKFKTEWKRALFVGFLFYFIWPLIIPFYIVKKLLLEQR